MKKFEYKTISLDFKSLGIFKGRILDPEFENVLNNYGREGWRLAKVVLPAKEFGESENAIIIFEREKN